LCIFKDVGNALLIHGVDLVGWNWARRKLISLHRAVADIGPLLGAAEAVPGSQLSQVGVFLALAAHQFKAGAQWSPGVDIALRGILIFFAKRRKLGHAGDEATNLFRSKGLCISM